MCQPALVVSLSEFFLSFKFPPIEKLSTEYLLGNAYIIYGSKQKFFSSFFFFFFFSLGIYITRHVCLFLSTAYILISKTVNLQFLLSQNTPDKCVYHKNRKTLITCSHGFTSLKITADWSSVKMTGQINFSSDIPLFWPDQPNLVKV